MTDLEILPPPSVILAATIGLMFVGPVVAVEDYLYFVENQIDNFEEMDNNMVSVTLCTFYYY